MVRDLTITTADELFQKWSRYREQGLTSVSLLMVLKVMHEYRNAMLAYNTVCERLDAELPDGWDDPFTGCGHLYGDLIRAIHRTKTQYAHRDDEFYPRLSRNRYSNGSDVFPISSWRKWIKTIQRDTKNLNSAIDDAAQLAA